MLARPGYTASARAVNDGDDDDEEDDDEGDDINDGDDGDNEGMLNIPFSSQNWKTEIQSSPLYHPNFWPFVIFWPKLNTCSQNLDQHAPKYTGALDNILWIRMSYHIIYHTSYDIFFVYDAVSDHLESLSTSVPEILTAGRLNDQCSGLYG